LLECKVQGDPGGELLDNTVRDREAGVARTIARVEEFQVPIVSRRATAESSIPSWMPKAALVVGDLVGVVVAMLLAALLNDRMPSSQSTAETLGYVVVGIGSLPLWLLVFHRMRLYSSSHVSVGIREFNSLFHAVVIGAFLTATLAFMLRIDVARSWLVLSGLCALVVIGSERFAARKIFLLLRVKGHLARPVFLVGWNDEARALYHSLVSEPGLGYQILGVIDDHLALGTNLDGECRVVARCADGLAEVQRSGANGVVIATTAVDTAAANDLARKLMERGYYVEFSSTLRDIAAERLLARPLGRFAFIAVEPVRLTAWRATAKRCFDVAGALFFLAITSPLAAVAAIAIKLDSRGPVFFRQTRVGIGGREFRIVKFRTMVADAEAAVGDLRHLNEAQGALFKIRDDPRVTRVGRLLRRTSFDEVPQFWNVLRGEMSIVGPRPALPTEVHAWSPELHQRLRVRPGITGMWQVNGRSDATFDDYVRLDIYYVDNWSLLTDFMIVLKTFPTVFSRRGAH